MEYLDAIPYLMFIGIINLIVDMFLLVYLSWIVKRLKAAK